MRWRRRAGRARIGESSRRVAPTRIAARDLIGEAVAGVLARPGRTFLTMLGVLLGVGTVVAVIGLTGTANGQIGQQFTALAATEVVVKQTPVSEGRSSETAFPERADQLAGRIAGVRQAGVAQDVTNYAGSVIGVPLPGATAYSLPVVAATAGYLPALRAEVASGRLFDQGAVDRGDPVAVLGAAAAQRLGVDRLESQPVVFVGGVALTVIGIVDQVARQADTLSSVIVPMTTAARLWPRMAEGSASATMVVDTDLGAAPVVADQLAVALRPDNPSALTVVPPPDPHTLRDNVQSDLNTLFLLLAAVSLIIGMLGIANTTLVAVLERTSEIGLRRALGARQRHIVGQFLAESAIIGGLGGLVGAALGVVAVVAVAIAKDWTPILDWRILAPAPLGGAVIGVLAGLYPAALAARIPPAEAFRR